MQELEVILVASTITRVKERLRMQEEQWEIIMHSHDGVLVFVNSAFKDTLLNEMNTLVKEVGGELGAPLTQYLSWEIKSM